ncbi:phosphate-induced protein 1 [Pilobolus umbonatus]|nr:phosphate-induced protein 1 [Pilobolus umbonatus]
MKLLTLGACILSTVFGIVRAQQSQLPNNASNDIITQYKDKFTNIGGSILHDKVNVYIVFYGNWTTPQLKSEQTIFMDFVDTISTSPWFNTLKQYTDNNGKSVTGPLNLAAAVNDEGSRGTELTNALHKQIILDAVNSGYLSPINRLDSNGVYVIMGGPNINDSEFCKKHCGYNSHSDEFQYMYIGYPASCASDCIPADNKDISPNNSPAMDAAITIFSHEIQDVLTDPRDDAWAIKQSDSLIIELGDFCSKEGVSADQFGAVKKDKGSYNLEIGEKRYLVQSIFNMEKKECTLG